MPPCGQTLDDLVRVQPLGVELQQDVLPDRPATVGARPSIDYRAKVSGLRPMGDQEDWAPGHRPCPAPARRRLIWRVSRVPHRERVTDPAGGHNQHHAPGSGARPLSRHYGLNNLFDRITACRNCLSLGPPGRHPMKSGRPGEFHPGAPTERSVTVSRHSALLIFSTGTRASRPSGRRVRVHFP